MDEAKCPHCKTLNEIDTEEYTKEDDWQEKICKSCDKKFSYTTNWTVDFPTKCIEADHMYEDLPDFLDIKDYQECSACGEWKRKCP